MNRLPQDLRRIVNMENKLIDDCMKQGYLMLMVATSGTAVVI